MYRIESALNYPVFLDHIILEYEGEDGWKKAEYRCPALNPDNQVFSLYMIEAKSSVSGLLNLGDYQNIQEGNYRLIIDTTEQESGVLKNMGVAVHEFEIAY